MARGQKTVEKEIADSAAVVFEEGRRRVHKMRTEPVETPSGYKVKPLTGGDLRALKKIVTENFEAVQKKLTEIERERLERQKELGSDVQLPADQGAGMAIVEIILEDAFDDAWEFLARMVGMTPEGFDDLPADAHLEVIETLVAEDDLPGFLQRYLALRRTFSNVLPTSASSATQSQNGS